MRNRYSKRESLNRIYRLLSSVADASSQEPTTVPPPYYSEDEAFSLIANLLAGTLEGETASLPSAVSVSSSLVSDATLGVPGTVKLPTYGQIYTSTGTVTVELGTTYAKITGSFHVNGLSSEQVTPQYNHDRIVINAPGTYFVDINYSMQGVSGSSYFFKGYLDEVAQNQLSGILEINDDGDEEAGGVSGFVNITTGSNLQLYGAASATVNCRLLTAGVSIFRLET